MKNTLKAEKRELTGKKVKQLRSQGTVPAVIFNAKGESDNVTVDARELERSLRGATKATIFEIEVDGKPVKVLVKEVQSNPKTDEIAHASFFQIDENAEAVYEIPFVVTGISPAVKNNLGTLFQPLNSAMVRCKLVDLVPNFEVNVSGLDHAGQTIKVKELNIPAAIKLVHIEDLDATVVTITEIQEEKVEEVVEVAASTEVVEGAEGEAAPAEGDVKAEAGKK